MGLKPPFPSIIGGLRLRLRVVITFRENKFAQPDRLVAFIRQHGQPARVRPDMKVVFFLGQRQGRPSEKDRSYRSVIRPLIGHAAAAICN